MPIPTVKCSVCGNTVNKAQTLSVGNGQRACKSHSDTASKASQAQEKLDEVHSKGREFKKRERVETHIEFKPRCFCCNTEGLVSQEYFQTVLLLQYQHEVLTQKELKMFTPEYAKVMEPLKDLVPLFTVPFNEKVYCHTRNIKDTARVVGWVGICGKCANKYDIKVIPEFGQLENWSLVAGLVGDHIKENIAQEMIKVN